MTDQKISAPWICPRKHFYIQAATDSVISNYINKVLSQPTVLSNLRLELLYFFDLTPIVSAATFKNADYSYSEL